MKLDNIVLSIHKDYMEVEVKNGGKIEIIKSINDLTVDEILDDIREHNYWNYYKSKGGRDSRDVILEDKMSFMPFAYAYYFLLTNVHHVPTVDELCEFYIQTFCIKQKSGLYSFKENFVFLGKKDHQFERKDLEAKICRAYNSFVRETVLLSMFFDLQKEKKYQNLEIYYDFKEDINGSDIVIKNNEKRIGLLITQASKNSDNYNSKKRDHRHKYEYDEYLYVKMGEDETFNCGSSKLFRRKVARNLLDKCLQVC